ncbi:Ig-like domain-containing protein [Paraglaciecola chathamensis]|uniref:Ig-like domain-containing protein n=1 Tax=Paraglaciecola chathamensis TaxID=368405 RepID=UPI0026FAF4CD|nr:Ig-like domain-containing protein [Paraglaciecola chathamensis]MDO6840216.1 Ig-like domain-containing protein [Paraglaciecola chathamensis]
MRKHLLTNKITAAMLTTFLAGCGGGTDEGYDPDFGASAPVTFDAADLTASFDEETGQQEVDLLAGATADGQPLSGTINISDFNFTVDQNFTTPQIRGNGLANQTVSPFFEQDGKLIIDTDKFSDHLSTCDSTDVSGGPADDNGNPTPDGFLDTPPQVTYTIDFAVDNGFDLAPGEVLPRRTLTLTMNAVFDAVESVTAEPIRVLMGQEAQLFATVLPEKACSQDLSYTIADPSIASIDDNGNISTLQAGETTVTVSSTDAPDKSVTVGLEVFSEFTLAITNRDLDSNGLPSDMKEVPACVTAGFNVSPTPAFGDSLTGDYTYSWTSSNDVDFPVTAVNYGESGVGMYQVGDATTVGFTFDASVSLASGDTGSTAFEDVMSQNITANVVQNLMCETGVSAHPAGFNTDFNLDGAGAPWKGGIVATSDDSLSGSALEVTAGDGESTNIVQQVFNKQRNWHSATYGLGTSSIGQTYKYSVWVKLPVMPTEDITLKHVMLAWTYEGGPSGPGFDFRRPTAGILSATLQKTTDWQLVEFVNEATGNREWSVPPEWNVSTDVFQFWEIYGLPEGEKILLDEYAVMPVQ